MNPEISIIVPVYNVDSYLNECIDSILAQTFSDIEVILVNDGSTDNSGHICDRYAHKDERVKVIHKKYGGVSSARNAGIEAATGKYIGFVDGDDRIVPSMYEELYNLCIKSGSDVSICRLGREIDGQLINKNHNHQVIEMDTFEALRQMFKGVLYRFSLCNKLFKRSCFLNIMFPEGRIHEDLSTTYKLLANAKKIAYKDFIGYVYVKRSNSILTSIYSEQRLDAFVGWDEILSFVEEYFPELYSEVTACFTYGLVDHVYYILNQVEDRHVKKDYLNRIREYAKKYYKQIRSNEGLSNNYKMLVSILKTNVELLIFTNNIRKLRKSTIVRS